jgi:hypothetical protein
MVLIFNHSVENTSELNIFFDPATLEPNYENTYYDYIDPNSIQLLCGNDLMFQPQSANQTDSSIIEGLIYPPDVIGFSQLIIPEKELFDPNWSHLELELIGVNDTAKPIVNNDKTKSDDGMSQIDSSVQLALIKANLELYEPLGMSNLNCRCYNL